jgi:Ca-activated chloride channel homolog
MPLKAKGNRRTTKDKTAARVALVVQLCLLLVALCFPISKPDQAEAAQTQSTQQPTPTPTPTATPTTTPTPTEAPAQTPTPAQSPTPSPSPTPDDSVVRVESDATNVLLSATDKKRRFVTTLRPEDLRVLEDGVPQQISYFEREEAAPLSLSILVDTSASQEKVMGDEQVAAEAFVRSVVRPDRDTASVVSFTGLTRLDQPPTNDTSKLIKAIGALKVEYTEDSPVCKDDNAPEQVRLHCYTGIWDAVVIAIQKFLAETPTRTRRAIILLTDGDDTSSKVRLYQAAEFAVRNDTVIYSIGIRDKHFKIGEMRRDFLREISEQAGGRAFFPNNADGLAAAFSEIEQELRSQYLISYTPTNRAPDGGLRKIQIEITNPELRRQDIRLLYRQSYYARGPATHATPTSASRQ